jgi:hypothetical protein
MTTKTNTGGPAFPIQGQPFTLGDTEYMPTDPGMTLRDWFAGQALAGLLSTTGDGPAERYAKASYEVADAMLAEREK